MCIDKPLKYPHIKIFFVNYNCRKKFNPMYL